MGARHRIEPADIEACTSPEALMSAFLTLGFQKRPGGWDCPHPDHRGGDSVSIFKGRGGSGAWEVP